MKRFLFGLGLFLISNAGQAALPNTAYFYYPASEGYFVKDVQTGVWSETIQNTEVFYFKEIGSSANAVDLFDPTRNMTVKLDKNGVFLKAMGETKFTFYRSGSWDNRSLFSYNLGAGRSGYYQLIGGNMYRHVTNDNGQKSSSYLRNNGRDYQTVNLLYPKNQTSYAIQGNEVFIQTKPGKWSKLFSGNWQ